MRTIYLAAERKYPATRSSIQFAALDVHWIARRRPASHETARGIGECVFELSTFMHARAEKYRQQCEERLNDMRASIFRATPVAICARFAAIAMGAHALTFAAAAAFPTPLPADTIPKIET